MTMGVINGPTSAPFNVGSLAPTLADPVAAASVPTTVTPADGDYTLVAQGGALYRVLHRALASKWLGALAGEVARARSARDLDRLSVKDFGAAGDSVSITGAITISSSDGTNTLTVAGAAFATTDVGKTIGVPGAGTTGGVLTTTIATRVSATQVTLTASAVTSVSAVSGTVTYGTDDAAAINAAELYASATRLGCDLWFPKGNYLISTGITKRSSVTWRGEGMAISRLVVTAAFSANQMLFTGGRTDFGFFDLGFDASGRTSGDTTAIATGTSVGNAKFVRCKFANLNKANTSSPTNGYGIVLVAPTDVLVEECQFDIVSGGIYCASGAIIRFKAVGNRITNDYFKGGIYLGPTANSTDIWLDRNLVSSSQSNASLIATTGATTFTLSRVRVTSNHCVGRDLAFSAGGNADLLSLKDMRDYAVIGNYAQDGGDLGVAIERSNMGVVNGNTARRNNSCGIDLGPTTHVTCTGNVCLDNTQNRAGDLSSPARPYGGIRIDPAAGTTPCSYISVFGNVSTNTEGTPKQNYGVIVLADGRSHVNLSISGNNCDGNVIGPYFNDVCPSALRDGEYDALPTKGRFFVGDRIRLRGTGATGRPGAECTTSGAAVKEAWTSGHVYVTGDWVSNAGKVYIAGGGGTASNAPTHSTSQNQVVTGGTDLIPWYYHATIATAVFSQEAARV
jgi:hypothetical protein